MASFAALSDLKGASDEVSSYEVSASNTFRIQYFSEDASQLKSMQSVLNLDAKKKCGELGYMAHMQSLKENSKATLIQ